ncbi:Relaxase/mobilization nuclease-like protein [Vibrio crassostreae]|uniref:hypothetical protein n=1 Tax=Vibrio crassostreae TaxID=246167 RepID=UPI0010E884FE|nr:hypothetical protein [Vibrio crassostreae]TCN81745.1 hypothetical protein EDB37_10252 [Vibrio crassostreae]CAK2437310.1 Relaxase/mobilization nuclease-like protein [Vibrio crassostreae]CAK2453673.1 Relaxase/mobilization nuclease-like protein [Vibrio crassostreae]CAK3107507.1 Relaxase/mobilization nuclease-like protein [Vibrio crassostreae]CAK3178420.1 Relaxase/mobilization nuclease-like protein [Vibrio crassostreae]
MLKNWTVITQATRNVMAREHYLTNIKHRNHKTTEKIIDIYGSEVQSLNMIRNCERYKLKQAAARKGGRPPTEAVEFCFTLPKSIRPSPKGWRQILNTLMRNLASHLDVTTGQLAPISRAVLHQQEQDSQVRGSGDHMHLIVGKFTDNLTYLAELQRKSTTRLLKTAFNNAVHETTGISHQSYEMKKNYSGTAKKRAVSWKVKAARKQKEIKLQKQQLKRMISQAEKWLQAYELGDVKQMNRQYNRLIKEVDTVDASKEETASLYEFMQQLVRKVESKAQKEGLPTSRMSQPNVGV